jgi:carbon monoxide dehydrogenase subunit G
MLIKNEFEVAQPPDKVWAFFDNIPQVAACLPGTELTSELPGDKYEGQVAVRMGPVKLQFAGTAQITEKDEAAHRIVVDAAGAEVRGRVTKVGVTQDLQLSGAAAQYGRGMIGDVTTVLMRDFSTNLMARIDAVERGLSPDQVAAARPASGLAIGVRAARMALTRVFRRFFLPYQPSPS